ncbi:gustatory and pheromone receptor 32a-like [Rhagoletis pomonella]|uniref:gustatory and pheromone receptor 32a-like n=1 Tax=Rhagoletis pomonella TaxID=28610 RepID=UPI00177B9137|nr:gustatory and pheromone receptor 32a-like [Rhagoletis pomonella]
MRNSNRGNISTNITPTRVINPILSYLKWPLLILKSMGLIPFYTTLNYHEIGMPNRRWLLINRAILYVKVALNVLNVYFLLSPKILEILFIKSKTDGFNNMTDAAFWLLGDFVILWSCARNKTKFIVIINRLMQIDQILIEFPESPVPKTCFKNRHNTYLLIIYCYMAYFGFLFLKRIADYPSFAFIVCEMLYQLGNAYSCTFVVFISSLLHLLAVRFLYINQFLSKYQRKMLQADEIPSRMFKSLNSSDKKGVINSEENLRPFAENLKVIYGLHSDLVDVLKMINDYTDLGLLAYFLYKTYGMLACTFMVFSYNWDFDEDFYTILWVSSWIPFLAGTSILLATSCDKATKEANKTSQVLARVYGKGEHFKTIVDKFLSKSLKQDVQFTAYGFFVIDNTTLVKIFSAVTTCLVILIQFKQLEESTTVPAVKHKNFY